MKHFYSKLAAVSLSALVLTTSASALSHTVVRGDTMWKLAVQYQVGTSEIIASNPQVSNPDLIYPGQILTIPEESHLRHPLPDDPLLRALLSERR